MTHDIGHRHGARRAAALTAAVLALTAAAGCSDDLDTGAAPVVPSIDDLAGRVFISTATEGLDLVDGTRIVLGFEDTTVGTSAGCNTTVSQVAITDGSLVVTPGLVTQMACDAPLEDQDRRLSELLAASPAVTLAGDELVLVGGEVRLVLRDRATLGAPTVLDAGAWVFVDVTLSDGTTIAAPDGANVTFDGGQAWVATGCNQGSAPVTVIDDDTIEVGPMALTRRACEPGLESWEQALLSVFEGELTATVDGDAAELASANGVLRIDLLPFLP
jgi:heat shock protein HslJ